jgi:caudovirus prohead protease|nr:MAG TPA: major capsid protein [Caudoviricetes sp.]
MDMDYDFSGWATRNNIECSDGRTIMKDAFKDNDGQKVPLVWNHQHDDPNEVLGHALLENRTEGVYAYCKFNDTESGQTAKSLVFNGDVDKLSIYANKLKSNMNQVIHGCIREVSLVLAGANPGAYIDSVIVHSNDADDEEEGVIYTDEPISVIMEHSEEKSEKKEETEMNNNSEIKHAKEEASEKTVQEIFDTLTDEQKNVVYAIIGEAIEEAQNNADEDDGEEGEDNMKHNVFDNDNNREDVLAHSEFVNAAIADAKRFGSMRESFIAHADQAGLKWGQNNNFAALFPDATNIDREPIVVEKDNSWVGKIMNDVKHSPFSRVKNTLGKLDETTARAKGYIKGNKKTNLQVAFLNRVTTPTTVYIKNDIDRDDIVDITDFDIVAWQKKEMRKQLDKELALSMLLGDGRDVSDQNKINEQNIRPVLTDNDMYTIKYEVKQGVDYKVTGNSASDNDSKTKGIIRAAIRARKDYRGSGKPSFYTTEDVLTNMLLIEDQNGRVIYDSVEKLATALRVKEIVTIPEMEKYTGVYGIIVNMNDYTAGADKGGSVNMFDDFDIDYNQMKYLMETRMSGALTVPYSAIVLKAEGSASSEHGIGG